MHYFNINFFSSSVIFLGTQLEATVHEHGCHLGSDSLLLSLGTAKGKKSSLHHHVTPLPFSCLASPCTRQPEEWFQKHTALGVNLSFIPD
jgi:hypothetical protein